MKTLIEAITDAANDHTTARRGARDQYVSALTELETAHREKLSAIKFAFHKSCEDAHNEFLAKCAAAKELIDDMGDMVDKEFAQKSLPASLVRSEGASMSAPTDDMSVNYQSAEVVDPRFPIK